MLNSTAFFVLPPLGDLPPKILMIGSEPDMIREALRIDKRLKGVYLFPISGEVLIPQDRQRTDGTPRNK